MKTEACFSSNKNSWVRVWKICFRRKTNYCGSHKLCLRSSPNTRVTTRNYL